MHVAASAPGRDPINPGAAFDGDAVIQVADEKSTARAVPEHEDGSNTARTVKLWYNHSIVLLLG